jgi:hypothetical protein
MPSSGQTVGANFVHERGQADGTTFLVTLGSTRFPDPLGDPRAKYESRDWQPTLISPNGAVAYGAPGLARPHQLDQLQDLRH